ncbi:ABC transporter permease [Streptococcus ovis]|uniref:ABC transporter permease n=1 Tax=Streptococcus ovis TaxID=82806 RepID=UPI00037895C4|nr:ABC transporter permease [Streptococcus ovis]
MKKRIYWKDIGRSIAKSKGRFFSIFSLMMIGSIALVGLKVTQPNMERTAQTYIDRFKMMDVAVMADYGLSQEDVEELSTVNGAKVEFGYMTDEIIADSYKALRIFSQTDTISQFELVSGQMPKKTDDIALIERLKGEYQIGDWIQLDLEKESPLIQKKYRVTGFVHSSEIWDQKSMGGTTKGTGNLYGYGVTVPESFDSDVYMMARLRYQDTAKLAYHSEAYLDAIEVHQKELEVLLADNGKERLSVLKAEAKKKLKSGQDEIAEVERKLDEGAQKLQEGEKQLADGQNQLANGRAQLSASEATLAQSWRELESAKAQLAQTGQQLTTAKVQLDASKVELDKNKTQLDTAAHQLAMAKAALDEQNSQLSASASHIQTGRHQWAQAKEQLQKQIDDLVAAGIDPTTDSAILALQSQLAKQDANLTAAEEAYNKGFYQYQEARTLYEGQQSQYESGRRQYESGLAQFNEALTQYQTGLARYQEGKNQYDTGLAQYHSGLTQLENGRAEIQLQEARLQEAQAELNRNKADFEEKQSKAQNDIRKGKQELQKAQQEVDKLEQPIYTVYTRSTFPSSSGYENYRGATTSISAVGNIFPVVLYVVAAMVTFTTMTRFVDEERTNTGILRALGYTKGQIIAKFVLYGLFASLLGTLAGLLIGNLVLSPVIGDIITGTTVIGSSRLYFYWSWTLLALLLAFVSAVLPAYLVAKRALQEEPSQLLQGKPPVSGSTILLERMAFIWKRLSFTHKVTARNIFRYKQRMLMTIFGVAGSVSLLFAGLGIQSSISGIADTQFGEVIQYDMMVVEKEEASADEKAELLERIQSDQIVEKLFMYYTGLTETILGTEEPQNLNVMVVDSDAIPDFVHLRERKGKDLHLTNQGVILTEKLASLYNVKIGEKIPLTLEGEKVQVTVSGISEMYAGHFLYMTPVYYEKLTGKSPHNNTYLAILSDASTHQVEEVAADFLALDGVSAVAQNTALISAIETVASSLQTVMIILIVLSVLLGIVILYNLTNINVAERIRELSTIKVLGFHNREVTLYIYRETIVLSIVGILVGLTAGFYIHKVILGLIGSAAIMFNPDVAIEVYLIPILAIVGILAVLGWWVNAKLRRVDMLEALKSVE